jgi:molybdenum transport protein
MLYIDDATIDRWIREDVPWGDLTTRILGFSAKKGRIRFFTRNNTVICGTEECTRIFSKLGIETVFSVPSGSELLSGELIFEGRGDAGAIHCAWKISLSVLEYASGISTRTGMMVKSANSEGRRIEIVATRKCFPGTKDLSIKAVLSGGGLPHRLGLSETVLVFDQHRRFMEKDLPSMIEELKSRVCEKKIIAEADSIDEALALCAAGIDGIQFDKVPPDVLSGYVSRLRAINPSVTVIAAGGITNENAAEYASTGINAIATGALYFGKPADIKAMLEPVE